MTKAQNLVSIITEILDDGHGLFDRETLRMDLTADQLVTLADMALEARRELATGLDKGIFTRYLNAIRTQPEFAAEVAQLLAAYKADLLAKVLADEDN